MTLACGAVHSSTLCFDRAGRRLVAIEEDAISIVDLSGSQTRRIEYPGVCAVAAFDDQLWIAMADRLVRLDSTGRPIGAPFSLSFASGDLLVPAQFGPPAAIWTTTPAVALIDDLGELVRTELAQADAVIPLTGRRHVVARGSQVLLPIGITASLAQGTGTVIGGAFLGDGRTVALVVARASERQLLTIAAGTGQLALRWKIPSSAVRLAARRAIAVVQLEPRLLCAIDLRNGRELGEIPVEHDVEDLAIDPDGRRLVLRERDTLEVHDLAELCRRPAVVSVTPPVRETADDPPCEPLPAPIALSPIRDRVLAEEPAVPPCPPLVTLRARSRVEPVAHEIALAQLDRELRRVALWTVAAIAAAWDSRRLGYGNEGRHPYEHEVAAIVGLNRGHACDHLATARELVAEHERVLASDVRWRATDTPVGYLRAEFELSERAIDVLMVVAAPALWGEIGRLYGILANDVARSGVDELAVQEVLGARYDRHAIAAELDPRAPLVRLGLVHVSPRRARPFCELAADPVVHDLLRAARPDLGDATALRPSDRALTGLDLPRDVLGRAIAAFARPSNEPLRVVVRGRTGSGRKTLLAALAREAGRELAVIDALALPREADPFDAELRRALRRAQLAGAVPCLIHLDELMFDERPARAIAAETLRLHPGPVAVVAAADAASPFPPGHVAIDLPLLAESERHAVWQRAVVEAGVTLDNLDAIAARYRIGPGLIRRAAAAARDASGEPAPAIDAYLRQTRDERLAQHARRVDRLAAWSDVVLPPDVLDSLRELVGRVRHGRTVFETWGMSRTAATARGLTALFQGPPGTGKTLVAGVVARELGLELYQVDLSKVMSKWIGETERNLSQIFDAAEDGQVVLLFDEADSLFAKRTEVRSSNDRYANLEVNYLLQRLDAFAGIAILTTNAGTSIDQAFKRRMSFRLSFPFPDEDTREQLWRAHLPPELPVAGSLALDMLARKYQLSGGYIRNACLRAAFLAAQQETVLAQHHLERAVALEFAELGKLSSSGAID